MQGLDLFSFNIDDAQRDPKTGALPALGSCAVTSTNAAAAAAAMADDSADEAGDPENATEGSNSDSDEEGGSTIEQLEGEDFNIPDVSVCDELPENYSSCIIGKTIYHRLL